MKQVTHQKYFGKLEQIFLTHVYSSLVVEHLLKLINILKWDKKFFNKASDR